MPSLPRRIVRSLTIPVLFGGYMFLVHYGWQKLQYSPVVNGGEEPATLSLEKFRRAFLGDGKSKEGTGDEQK